MMLTHLTQEHLQSLFHSFGGLLETPRILEGCTDHANKVSRSAGFQFPQALGD